MTKPELIGNSPALALYAERDKPPGPRLMTEIAADLKPAKTGEARFPRRFDAVTLAGFQPTHAKQKRALAVVHRWVEKAVAKDGEILCLVGPAGCGKSHLLYGAARELAGKGLDVECRSWYTLADELRYGDGRLEAHQVRRRVFGECALMLDEVRPTASTDFDDTELTKIVCHAWDNKRPLLLTTNIWPLNALVGPQVISRVTSVIVEGDDMRKVKP